ncbi:MAG: hypothetical protein HKN76_09105, partial [Saprospiraceae bacterium]|nr:hypothetical protein [Saprospiraceae bacterium]
MQHVKIIDVRVLIWILSALMLYPLAAAQEQRKFSFQHFSTADGLVSNQVNSIVQDQDGYLWIGTTDGLQRYDGIRHYTFRYQPGAKNALPANAIAKLLYDKKNRLWLLMANGQTGIFDTKKFLFYDATLKAGDLGTKIRQSKNIFMDELGGIFLLLESKELFRWDEYGKEFIPAFSFLKQDHDWRIESFVHEPGSKKYWMGLYGGSFIVYNAETQNLSSPGHNIEDERLIDYYANVKTP